MTECEKVPKCPFYHDQMSNMPDTAEADKEKYCQGSKEECARYMVSGAGIAVPSDLFPRQADRAREIMNG